MAWIWLIRKGEGVGSGKGRSRLPTMIWEGQIGSVNGTANAMTSTFDALGRLSGMTTDLGEFTYAYNATKGLLETPRR